MSASIVRAAVVAALLALCTADAVAQQAPASPPAAAARRAPRGDRNKLTQAELAQAGGVVTALDAIRLLRPQWLNPPRGRIASSNADGATGSATQIVVYLDDLRQPDLESSLITVKVETIVEMRYLDQNRAVQNRGPGHEAGVIEVITTARRR